MNVTEYWKAVCENAIVVDTAGNKLQLPAGALWNEDIDLLYVRSSYRALNERIVAEKPRKAMVSGTPGIGKSLFGLWFVYQKVVEAKAANESIPTFVFSNRSQVKYYMSHSDGKPIVTVCDGVHGPIPDYYISDTFGMINAKCNILNLHLTSSGSEGYDIFTKDNQCNGYILGPFSFAEYFECDGCATNEELLQFKYDIFGGSLRLLRKIENTIYNQKVYDIVQLELQTFFDGVFAKNGKPVIEMYNYTVELATRVISRFIVGTDPKKTSKDAAKLVESSLFRHQIQCGPNAWDLEYSSVFMGHLAAALCKAEQVSIIEDLRAILGQSAMGFLFERDAHQLLYQKLKGEGIIVKSMKESGRNSSTTIKLNVTRKVLIRSIADIASLLDTDYGMPIFSNFPLVDAIVQPCYEFQMTIGMSHKGAVDRQPEIALNLRGTPKMIFVLDYNKNYEQFTRVQDLKVEQFKIYHAFSTGDISVRKRKRAEN